MTNNSLGVEPMAKIGDIRYPIPNEEPIRTHHYGPVNEILRKSDVSVGFLI